LNETAKFRPLGLRLILQTSRPNFFHIAPGSSMPEAKPNGAFCFAQRPVKPTKSIGLLKVRPCLQSNNLTTSWAY